jgi:glycosyltransferase involved in cell wall biosynthesis|tara:strand:+ start:42552 stop:44432 length:1881 start_codon:yes stop_codon:yes gene_type:complete
MRKKKILFHSNHSKAFTGFGKNTKNVLKYLYKTGKYEIVEFANGLQWSHPSLKKTPWKTIGSLPDDQAFLQKLNQDPQLARSAGYGANMVDKVITQEKPDLYIGSEDIWAFNGYMQKEWWNKTNCMIWTTLDSLPILPLAVNEAKNIKNYYVWSSFAEKALHEIGHDHVKTLHGAIDCSTFYRLEDEQRLNLRKYHGINEDDFVIGFVFRNQLRKSVPNILEGFKLFLDQEPRSNAKLLLHTHWSEGWDIPRLIQEKGIDPQRILTTYFCSSCGSYEVRNFTGQEQNCKVCGSKTLNTTNVKSGVNEKQLNEVYNLMDVYCHPFTSGGQEIPIQEAKLTELITLVTDYSCGEDSCNEASGGIPLDWSEYREPGTQFIKATTSAFSIAKNLKKVFNMKPDKRSAQGKKSRDYVIKEYSVESVGAQLENIIDEMPEIDWDFDLSFKSRNADYDPPAIESNKDWVINLYKNILNKDVDENDDGHKHWMHRLSNDMNRNQVLEYFKSVARKENNENNRVDFASLIEDNDNKKAIMICGGDENLVFAATSLFESFHENYQNTDLYFSCHPKFVNILKGNDHVKKIIPYDQNMENELLMIGHQNHKGYFDHYINLNHSVLKNISSKNCHAFC